jgi:general stress protein YciG
MYTSTEAEAAVKEHLREAGRKGGKTVTAARLDALARAREAKSLYRRDPSQHPSHKRNQQTEQTE